MKIYDRNKVNPQVTFFDLERRILVLEPPKVFDESSSSAVKEIFKDKFKECGGIIFFAVDLTNVEYVGRTGLGVLIGALKDIRGIDGAGVDIICPNPKVWKGFMITGLFRIFKRTTREEVLAKYEIKIDSWN